MITRNNSKPLQKYTFKAEDDWGDYNNGKFRNGSIKNGYRLHMYDCTNGKKSYFYEHVIKWIYFNGEIPKGYVIDHIIPISNGGTNKLSNLRCVTQADNNRNPLTRKNLSKAHIGKPRNIGAGAKPRKVYQHTLDGVLVRVFDCVGECERNGYNGGCISLACRGKYLSEGNHIYRGYYWLY